MYQTITTRYQEYKLSASKKCKCDKCGKSFTRQRTFTETRNPFNKNENGDVKTGAEIYKSLEKEIEKWKARSETHICK